MPNGAASPSFLEDVEPWHVAAAGAALLGFALLYRRLHGGGGGDGLSFASPPEGYAALESESVAQGCGGRELPGTSAFRSYVMGRFGGTDMGIFRPCLTAPSGHYTGRAWDWGVLSGRADVNAFFRWLFANDDEIVRRAGITYVIYNGRIWNTNSRSWQAYSGVNPHIDHVHISFGTPGANGRTSLYRALASRA